MVISTKHLILYSLIISPHIFGMSKKEFVLKKGSSFIVFAQSKNLVAQDFLSDDKDECFEYNIVVKMLVKEDFNNLDMLLNLCRGQKYSEHPFLLKCSTSENGKNILHHVLERMDTYSFWSYLKCTHTLLALHPELVTMADNSLRFPMSYVTKIKPTSVEYTILKNMIYNYDKENGMTKNLFWFWLKNKRFEKAQDMLRDYSNHIKNNPFLSEIIFPSNKQTYAHCIVKYMDCDNFLIYFDILNTLLQYHPHLAKQKDGFGITPYEYVNSEVSDKWHLSNEQKKTLSTRL